MYNTLRSRLLKPLALSVVAAATAQMPQFAGRAQAGTPIHVLNDGDVIKLKTVWGGGYALNVGYTGGSRFAGASAVIHWNTGWDTPNRFEVMYGSTYFDGGFKWTVLRNRYSGMCLTVMTTTTNSSITQQPCSQDDARQYFAMLGVVPGQTAPMFINLSHYRAAQTPGQSQNLNTFLTQAGDQVVGDLVGMNADVFSHNRQEWFPQSCLVNGVEQQHC